MKIVKSFNFFISALLTVTVAGLTSCLNEPATDPPQTTVNQSIGTVDADYIGAYPSLAAAPDGRLHASYYAKFDWDLPGGGALRHAVLQNGVWTPDVVDGNVYDAAVDVGQFTSIAADAQGGLHIAYWDVANAVLKYATLPPGEGQPWQISTVADLTAVCEDASLKLDAAGNVHIGYCDGAQVWVATKNGTDWTITPVAALSGADSRAKVSLEFDGSNLLHVAFFDPVARQIKYTFGPAAGPFQTPETVATLGNDETRMDLTLDAAGGPHLVYYDITQKMLMHSYKTGPTTWTVPQVIAQIGDVTSTSDGSPTTGYLQLGSLMDLQGRLHVSYYQGTGAEFGNQDLKHVVLRTGDWAAEPIETIDDAGDVGRTSAMTEDADGTIHIIYRDSTNNDLKYAYLQ